MRYTDRLLNKSLNDFLRYSHFKLFYNVRHRLSMRLPYHISVLYSSEFAVYKLLWTAFMTLKAQHHLLSHWSCFVVHPSGLFSIWNYKCFYHWGNEMKSLRVGPIIWCFISHTPPGVYNNKQMASLCHFILLFMTIFCFTFSFFYVNNFSQKKKKT